MEALRRLEQAGGIRRKIEIFLSRASLEPGILGIVKPVLIWPHGISDRLEDAHLEAILAHEVWHVRRNDNLAAAVHMLVEAIFWFHPLVWWLGARMVEERERACDEEVLQLGSQPQVYAESILKICEFCVGSPLACVAGVTGSDLKKRIANIMNKNIVRKLNFGKKLLLSALGVAAIALPIVFGLAKPAHSQSQYPARIWARRRLFLLVDISKFQSCPAKPETELSKPESCSILTASWQRTRHYRNLLSWHMESRRARFRGDQTGLPPPCSMSTQSWTTLLLPN